MSYNKIVTDFENQILGHLINSLLDEGYKVDVEPDGNYTMVYAYEDGKQMGWVRFVNGKGAGVISDYTTQLEEKIKATIAIASSYED